jgi:hypothetical protein
MSLAEALEVARRHQGQQVITDDCDFTCVEGSPFSRRMLLQFLRS